VDQAGRLALRRHPQRHDRPLAQGIKAKGEMRDQFHHVIDVADHPGGRRHARAAIVNGVTQTPIEGFSMVYSFNDAKAPRSHDVQYFEMIGNRGIYTKAGPRCTKHRTPWSADTPCAFDDDVWELYDPDDWTQSNNIVKDHPEKLAPVAAAVADRGHQVQRGAAGRPGL
jgi:arylsulfatase A-like enzyme